jgi:hypothetical protein
VDNVASQKILTRVGFTRTGEVELSGNPGFSYVLAIDPVDKMRPGAANG